MNTNKKLYNITDITNWKHDPATRANTHGYVYDGNGNKYMAKGGRATERMLEMIVTKACEKANFDAINNEFAYNNSPKLKQFIASTPLRHIFGGVTPTLSLISPYLDYEIEEFGNHLPDEQLQHQNIIVTHITEIFNRRELNLNDKFKGRYIDEVLLRSLFEDYDANFHRNIFVKRPEGSMQMNGVTLVETPTENGSFTKFMPPELELTPSIDFDRCLLRVLNDPKSTRYTNFVGGEITDNLKYIRKHHPQNAEKFFADFSFDSATMDEIFDLNGAPLEWLLKGNYHPKKTPNKLNLIGKCVRKNFKQNLAFMKEAYTK